MTATYLFVPKFGHIHVLFSLVQYIVISFLFSVGSFPLLHSWSSAVFLPRYQLLLFLQSSPPSLSLSRSLTCCLSISLSLPCFLDLFFCLALFVSVSLAFHLSIANYLCLSIASLSHSQSSLCLYIYFSNTHSYSSLISFLFPSISIHPTHDCCKFNNQMYCDCRLHLTPETLPTLFLSFVHLLFSISFLLSFSSSLSIDMP